MCVTLVDKGEGAVTGSHEVVQPDAHGSHMPGIPDNLSLWVSSMFWSDKLGFCPFNSEDPSCAIINSAMDERPVADDSLTVVMEADLATGATRPEAQFNQFLTDKLCAWKHVQVDHVTRMREELEDMRVTNSVAYARDLKELHVARIEMAEELWLHQVFMERQRLAIQEEQESNSAASQVCTTRGRAFKA